MPGVCFSISQAVLLEPLLCMTCLGLGSGSGAGSGSGSGSESGSGAGAGSGAGSGSGSGSGLGLGLGLAALVHDLRVLDIDRQPELRAAMVRSNVAIGLLVD